MAQRKTEGKLIVNLDETERKPRQHVQIEYDKKSKEAAGYVGPHKDIHCRSCAFFGGNSCGRVQGKIDPLGCCNLWEDRESYQYGTKPNYKWESGQEVSQNLMG